jgi:hypothetical protein
VRIDGLRARDHEHDAWSASCDSVELQVELRPDWSFALAEVVVRGLEAQGRASDASDAGPGLPAPPGLPDLTAILPGGKAALRFALGSASLAAGGWVLQALRDAPAALGASPAAIQAVAEGSPNYRGGVFHNLEPSSPIKLDAEENRMLLFEVLANRSASLPTAGIPMAEPASRAKAAPLAATWLGHATALVEMLAPNYA